jgi:glycosyltransferase involved in cell wall biosynthesis
MVLFERRIVRSFAAITVVGEDDARWLRRIGCSANVHVIPNGVVIDRLPEQDLEHATPTVTFTGVLDYPPNVDAIRFFVDEIWPAVQRRVPNARFVIAGRNPVPSVAHLNSQQGIEVLANVRSMRAVVQGSWVCVAPMISGSGIKNKVLEAWACAKAVVMTPLATNGLCLDGVEEACVASTPREFGDRVALLLESKEARRALGESRYRAAAASHTWDAAGERMDQALRRLVGQAQDDRVVPP